MLYSFSLFFPFKLIPIPSCFQHPSFFLLILSRTCYTVQHATLCSMLRDRLVWRSVSVESFQSIINLIFFKATRQGSEEYTATRQWSKWWEWLEWLWKWLEWWWEWLKWWWLKKRKIVIMMIEMAKMTMIIK